MRILDKITFNQIEYFCIQILVIDDKKVFILYNEQNEDTIYLKEDEKTIVTEEKTIEKIEALIYPKTDIRVTLKDE